MLRPRTLTILIATGLAGSVAATAQPASADTPKEAKKTLFGDLTTEFQRGLKVAGESLPFAVKEDDWDSLECWVSATFVGCEVFDYMVYCSKDGFGEVSCGCAQPNGQDCELPDLPEE